ncbi:MAG: SGNH/GDSL hydrolase family protein [Chloroflexi bacterium]|nr:SGNH/GDSL hydrolase family protein [Chloroflexota bacterium]
MNVERHLIKVFGVIFALTLAACTATLGENNKLTPSTQETDSPLTTAKPSNGTLVPAKNPEVTFKGKPLLVIGDSNTDERNPQNIVNTMRLDHFTCIGCSANELAVQALSKDSLMKQLESGRYVGVIFIAGSTNPQEGTKNLVELFECLKIKKVELFGLTSFVPGHIDKKIEQDWRMYIEQINKVIREYSGTRLLDMQSKVEAKNDPWQGPWETSRIGLNNEQDGNHYNDKGLAALRQEIIKWMASMR